MTGQSDEKNGERAKQRLSPEIPSGGAAPVKAAASGDVHEEVARVVNLLQRLDKLHSQPNQSGPSGQANPSGMAAVPGTGQVRSTGADGLSTLSALKQERPVSRAMPAAPVPYLVPPPAPVVRPVTPDAAGGGAPPDVAGPLPLVLGKPEPASGAPARTKIDRAPIALIGSVIAGVVALGSWGLFNLQSGGVTGQAAAPKFGHGTALPTEARADAVALLAPPKTVKPEGVALPGCGTVALSAGGGALSLAVSDPAMAGQAATVTVDGLAFRTGFESGGRLNFRAPLLSPAPVVRWAGAGGKACEQTATVAAGPPVLRVALVWSGDGALDFHVIEPNAWFGGPSGHISNLSPNSGRDQGVGSMDVFGQPGSTTVFVYDADPARIPAGGVINAFVKPGAPAGETCGEEAKSAPGRQVHYQVHILRAAAGQALHQEVQAFSMQVPACGGGAGAGTDSERIMVRN